MSKKRKQQKKPRSSDGFLAIGATVCLFGMVCVGAQGFTTPDTRTGQKLVKQVAAVAAPVEPEAQPVKLWVKQAETPKDPGNIAEFLQYAKQLEDEALAEICKVKKCETKNGQLVMVAQAETKPGKDKPYGAKR